MSAVPGADHEPARKKQPSGLRSAARWISKKISGAPRCPDASPSTQADATVHVSVAGRFQAGTMQPAPANAPAPVQTPVGNGTATTATAPAGLKNPIDNIDQVSAALAGLQNEIKMKLAELQGNNTLSQRKQSAIKANLIDIQKALETLAVKIRHPEKECGDRIARDGFVELKRLCTLARANSPKDSNLFAFFNTLKMLANELKRWHASRAGVHELDDYARLELANLDRVNPGVARGRPGSEITSTRNYGFFVKTTAFSSAIADLGPMLQYEYETKNQIMPDDDGSALQQNFTRHTGRFGILFNAIKRNFGGPSEQHILTCMATASMGKIRGNYFNYKTAEDCIKARVQRDAERWKFFYRSGSKQAVSNRLCGKLAAVSGGIAKTLLGEQYVAEIRPPNVGYGKMKKGACNGTKIVTLARQLDQLSSGGQTSMADALHNAYKPFEASLETLLVPTQSGESFGTLPKNPLRELVPVASPGNGMPSESGLSVNRTFIGFNTTLKLDLKDALPSAQGSIHPMLMHNTSHERVEGALSLMRYLAPHAQLDPIYSCNSTKSHDNLKKLESAYAGTVMMHTFQRIKKVLSNGVSGSKSPSPIETANRIDNEAKAIQTVRKQYIELVHLAGVMHSLKEKDYADMVPLEKAAFETRFTAFIEDVFGISEGGSERQRFAKKLRSDPDFFMTKCFDVLSTTLGQIGLHIHDTRKTAPIDGPAGQHIVDKLHDGREQVERNYEALTQMMDGIHMPITEENLMRNMSLQARSVSTSIVNTFVTDFSAGLLSSFLSFIPGNSSDATSPSSTPGPNPVRGSMPLSPLGSVGGSMTFFNKFAINHPNLVRAGHFFQVRLSIKGGGLLAPMIAVVTEQTNKLCDKATKTKPSEKIAPATPEEKSKLKAFAATALNRFTFHPMADTSSEKEFTYGIRRPNSEGSFTYAWKTQFWRMVDRTNSRSNISLGGQCHPPSPIGVTISGTTGRAELSNNVDMEYMGTCLGYQIIQAHDMFDALDGCAPKQGPRSCVEYRDLSKDYDFGKLRGLLLQGKETVDAAYRKGNVGSKENPKPVDSAYMLDKWFAHPETILGIMEDYLEYLECPRRWNGMPRLDKARRTEFDRFDDILDFWNTILNMGESACFSGRAATKGGQSRESFIEARKGGLSKFDPRPKLSKEELAEVKRSIATLRKMFSEKSDMKPAERMEIFLNDAKNSPGRIVFQAYMKMLEGYDRINTAAKANITYATEVAGQLH